jgi:hypothetical protein
MLISSIAKNMNSFPFGGRMFSVVTKSDFVQKSIDVAESIKKILREEKQKGDMVMEDFKMKQNHDLRIPSSIFHETRLANEFSRLEELKTDSRVLSGRVEIFLRRFAFSHGNILRPGLYVSCEELEEDLKVARNLEN